MSYNRGKTSKTETLSYGSSSNFKSAEKNSKKCDRTSTKELTQKNENKIKSFVLFSEPIEQEYNCYKNRKILNYSSIKQFNKNLFKARIIKKEQVLKKINSFYSNFMKDKILSPKNLNATSDLNFFNKKNYFLTNIETGIKHKKLNSVDNFIENKNNKNINSKQKNELKCQNFSTTNSFKSSISRYESKNYGSLVSKYLLLKDKSNQLIINNSSIKKKFGPSNYYSFSNDISEMRTNANTNTKNNSNINTPIYMKTEKIKNIRYD